MLRASVWGLSVGVASAGFGLSCPALKRFAAEGSSVNRWLFCQSMFLNGFQGLWSMFLVSMSMSIREVFVLNRCLLSVQSKFKSSKKSCIENVLYFHHR